MTKREWKCFWIGWASVMFVWGASASRGAVIDDLKACKELPVQTILWPTPAGANADEVIELGRIAGSVGLDANEEKAAVLEVLGHVKAAQAKRAAGSKPVTLALLFKPWNPGGVTDPTVEAAWSEFGKAYSNAIKVHEAQIEAGVSPAPAWTCVVDSEGFDCRTDPKRSKCVQLYGAYNAFLATLGCSEVYWYSFAAVPAPALPDEWGTHSFAVPFPGMASLGFEIYYINEAIGRREASRRARAMATTIGITKTSAWIAAPGSGRVFKWSNAAYSDWTWNPGPDTAYDTQLGRELYVSWYRNRPQRYMDPVDAVCVYLHPLDSRIVDPERKHLLAFLRGVSE